MAAFMRKFSKHTTAPAQQVVFDDAGQDGDGAEGEDIPEIHYTSSDSTLVFRMSLPSLDIDTALTFEVGLGGSMKKVKEYIDFMLDGITTELAEEVGEECPGVTQEQFGKFVKAAESKMDEWQMRLKKADQSVHRAERLKAELVRMREAYHKDLMSLRQQLAIAANKENENGFDLDVVMHFDARKFMHEEEQLIADLQAQLKQQEKTSSRMIKNLEADIEAMSDRLMTKDLLADRQALLIEALQKEQGDMNEQMALQLQEAMSSKEAEYAAKAAELKAEIASKQCCARCRGRTEDGIKEDIVYDSLASAPASPTSPSSPKHSSSRSQLSEPTGSSARRGANGEETRQESKQRRGTRSSMIMSFDSPRLSTAPESPREQSLDGIERPFSQAENLQRDPQAEEARLTPTAPPGKKNVRRRGLVGFFGARDMQDAMAYSENVAMTIPPGERSFKQAISKSTTSITVQTELCIELLEKAQSLLLPQQEGGEKKGVPRRASSKQRPSIRERRISAPAGSPQVSEKPRSNNSRVSTTSTDDFDKKIDSSQKPQPSLKSDVQAAFADIKDCQLQAAEPKATDPVSAPITIGDLPPELTAPPPAARPGNGNGPAKHEATKPVGTPITENDLPELTEPPPTARHSSGNVQMLKRPAPIVAQKTDRPQNEWQLQSDHSANAEDNSANMCVLRAFTPGNKMISARPAPLCVEGMAPPSQPRQFSGAPSRNSSPPSDAPWGGYSAPSPSASYRPSATPQGSTSFPVQKRAPPAISNGKLIRMALQQQYVQLDDDLASVNENLLSDEETPDYPASFNAAMMLPSLRIGEDIRSPASSQSARGDHILRLGDGTRSASLSSRGSKEDIINRLRKLPGQGEERQRGA